MKNRRGASRLLALAGVVLAATFSIRAHGAEFRLRWLSPEGAGPARIQLTADPGPVYTIERSTNLAQWLPVLSGPLTNGTLDLFASAVPGTTAVFYRGRVADATNSSPPIQVSLDLRRVGVALVTPEAGGSCAVTNDAGVRFTFTVGPSNVIEAVPVVMTLIKQLTGLPETEGPPAAVQFEPDGYEFLGSGTLEILFPTNLNMLAMSSFTCRGDGTELHLLPDTVETNRVIINLTHFSPAARPAFSEAGLAQMLGRTVRGPVNQVEQKLGNAQAEQLQARRQGKLDLGDPELLAEVIVREDVLPNLEKASRDCTEAAQLSEKLQSLESYLRDNGINPVTSPSVEQFRSGDTGKNWICNCVQQGQDACRSGEFEAGNQFLLQAEEIRSQLGVGMDQLKGCLPDPAPPNLKKLMDLVPCNPSWKGDITVTSVKNSMSYYHDFFGDPFEHSEQKDVFTFTGHVVSSTLSEETGEWELNLLGTIIDACLQA